MEQLQRTTIINARCKQEGRGIAEKAWPHLRQQGRRDLSYKEIRQVTSELMKRFDDLALTVEEHSEVKSEIIHHCIERFRELGDQ